ncbi:hypothetical protein BGP_5896 [Beggiatoa sp. PS]|nr:hypothetical protein BGP_5896 [Beggiatoa sp. PS]
MSLIALSHYTVNNLIINDLNNINSILFNQELLYQLTLRTMTSK